MRKICSLSALLVLASALAFAETWAGQLFDGNCVDQHTDGKYGACSPTVNTATFTIQASGKMFKLDAAGNRKAVDAWKEYSNSADRAKDPNMPDKPVTATVTGTLAGDEIKVESIQLR